MNKATYFLLMASLSAGPTAAYQSLKETGFYDTERYNSSLSINTNNENHRSKLRNQYLFGLYSPQYPLWTDGAKKRRWVYLPKNGLINTDNKDRWVFPVGTKLWKEFSLDEDGVNRKIETRFLEKVDINNWKMETYVWNDEQNDAFLAPDEGIKDHYPLGNGKFYDIPSQRDCLLCHSKAGIKEGPQREPALGFSALQLSNDRDPNAIHGEPLKPAMISLATLQRLRKTTTRIPKNKMPRIPESINAPLQRSVFGYLHANCGHCHNDSGISETVTTLDFYHDANAEYIQQNGTYKTAIAKPIADYLQPPGSPLLVIDPGYSTTSALLYRMTEEQEQYTFVVPGWHHNAGFSLTVKSKMPIVGTNVIDREAIDIISEYIDSLRTTP